MQALPPGLREEFEEELKRGLRQAYPERDGVVVMPFRRVFVVARRLSRPVRPARPGQDAPVPLSFFVPAEPGPDASDGWSPTDAACSLWSEDHLHGVAVSGFLARAAEAEVAARGRDDLRRRGGRSTCSDPPGAG